MSIDIDQVAVNRFEDALFIQAGASNSNGIGRRTVVRAINDCHRENVRPREDAAVRLIVISSLTFAGSTRSTPRSMSTASSTTSATKRTPRARWNWWRHSSRSGKWAGLS